MTVSKWGIAMNNNEYPRETVRCGSLSDFSDFIYPTFPTDRDRVYRKKNEVK